MASFYNDKPDIFTAEFARSMDAQDELRHFRDEFLFPKAPEGKKMLYFCGNSLGLQPKRLQTQIARFLGKWANEGVEGHFKGVDPWVDSEKLANSSMAHTVGALSSEVILMNTLTVNIHLMMVNFFRPTATRFKILMEDNSFPSDYHAVVSQLRFHNLDPDVAMIRMKPRDGEYTLRTEDILQRIETEGDSIALVMFSGIQYYTGQFFDIPTITDAGHAKGCIVGWDLAHCVGNVPLQLHDWNVDFACWCTYKYLNSGPGAIGGCFVHERHHVFNPHTHATKETDTEYSLSNLPNSVNLPRKQLSGWWGHQLKDRFVSGIDYVPSNGAAGFQLSTPPALLINCVKAALDVLDEAGGIQKTREKALKLTGYLEALIDRELSGHLQIITPRDVNRRGCQLCVFVTNCKGSSTVNMEQMCEQLKEEGIIGDSRKPNIMRIAPAPLYNSYEDVFDLITILKRVLI